MLKFTPENGRPLYLYSVKLYKNIILNSSAVHFKKGIKRPQRSMIQDHSLNTVRCGL